MIIYRSKKTGRAIAKPKITILYYILAFFIVPAGIYYAWTFDWKPVNNTLVNWGVNMFYARAAEYSVQEPIIQYVEVDNLGKKVDELKAELLAKLAQCESGGTEEPDAAIILDTNKKMSIGKYMWQITSVQHYASLFYGQEISRKEAILIALGEGSIDLDELTEKVVFEDEKGWRNWHNCATKEGLYAEVELIKRLES